MPTVMSAFDADADARHAMERLLEHGFGRDAVHLRSGSTPRSGEARAETTPGDESLYEGIPRFLADLLGSNEERAAEAFAEVVRRGGTVLVVEAASDAKAAQARQIMKDAGGATDSEATGDRWRREGLGTPAAGDAENDRLAAEIALASSDTNIRLESDSGTLPGTDTSMRIDLAPAAQEESPTRRTAPVVEEVVASKPQDTRPSRAGAERREAAALDPQPGPDRLDDTPPARPR